MRVVIADNDEDVLDLLELDLRLEGHDVVGVACDGTSAVAACERERPDVLVVDYRMPPGIDGVEVARQVTAAGSVGRVIVHSNYHDRRPVRAAAALGAAFLRKGDLASLRAAIVASDLRG